MKPFLHTFLIVTFIFSLTCHSIWGTNTPQKTCHALKALRKPVVTNSTQKGGSWRVGRVSRISNSQESFIDPDENFCSVAHGRNHVNTDFVDYGAECGAIHYTKTVNDDGNLIATALTYNKRTGDLLRYRKVLYSKDPNYIITEGELTEMERITKDNKITKINPIPEFIKKNHAAMYAVIAIAPHGNWSISQTCDKKIAWVLFPAEIPSPEEEFVQKYANEIDRQLLQLGINKSTMEKVPLNLPFHPSIPVSKS